MTEQHWCNQGKSALSYLTSRMSVAYVYNLKLKA